MFTKFSLLTLCFVLVQASSSSTHNYDVGRIDEVINEYIAFELIKNPVNGLKTSFDKLQVKITFVNNYRLRVKIQNADLEHQRFEVPLQLVLDERETIRTSRQYDVRIGDDSVLEVVRRSTNSVIWSMHLSSIIFGDDLVQATNQLSSFKLFGLGEHVDSYLKQFQNESKTYLLKNSGSLPLEQNALYGSHPVYLNYENGSTAHSVFLLNSNAMEIVLSPNRTITWRGKLSFFLNSISYL